MERKKKKEIKKREIKERSINKVKIKQTSDTSRNAKPNINVNWLSALRVPLQQNL